MQACDSAVQQLESGHTAVAQVLVSRLSDAAKPALLHVRSIAATYRMANRPDPTKASHYVDSLLRSVEVRPLFLLVAQTKAFAPCACSDATAPP